MMHILIGILQHNKYGITKRCIDKIIENTNDVSYDIFLIDNGSMDGSANSIKKIYNEIDNIKIVLNLIVGSQYFSESLEINSKIL